MANIRQEQSVSLGNHMTTSYALLDIETNVKSVIND